MLWMQIRITTLGFASFIIIV